MTIGNLVYGNGAGKDTGIAFTAIQVAVAAAVAGGSTIIVQVMGDATSHPVVSITDSQSNTYHQIVNSTTGGAYGLYYAYNVTALSTSDTITGNVTSGTFTASIAYWTIATGITTDSLDVSVTANGTSTTPDSGASGNTAQDNCIACGFIGRITLSATSATLSSTPSGYTQLTKQEFNETSDGYWYSHYSLYNVLSSHPQTPDGASGTLSAASAHWWAVTVVFKGTNNTAFTRSFASTLTPSTGFGRIQGSIRPFASAVTPSNALSRVLAANRAFASTITASTVVAGAKVTPRAFASTVAVSTAFTKMVVQNRGFTSTVTVLTVLARRVQLQRTFTTAPVVSTIFTQAHGIYPRIKMGVTSVVSRVVPIIRNVLGG